jgi:hypothetical protein
MFLAGLLGGGGQKSTVTQKVSEINKIITNSFVSTMTGCSSTAEVQQNVNLKNNKGKIKLGSINQNATVKSYASCQTSNNISNDIKNDIVSKLGQYSKSQQKGIEIPFFGGKSSKTNSVIERVNDIANNIDVQSTVNQIAAATSIQNIDFSGNEGQIEADALVQNAASEAVMRSITNNTSVTNAVNALASDLQQTAESSQTGFDISGILSGILGAPLMLVGSCGVVLLIFILILFFSSSSSSK